MTEVMTTHDVANQLVDMCRTGQMDSVLGKLYAANIRSVESMGENKDVQGTAAVQAKGEHFNKAFEVHGLEVSDPLVAGNHFACTMKLDCTQRESGQRMKMEEVCVYEVQDGKIVLEQFFYSM